ncbi:MAG: S26 family signal peptidase [Methanomassiliicoccaceae archaeon]|nr:S26 family signal peptidase [Methanomassiliicoccaceae archaeon]
MKKDTRNTLIAVAAVAAVFVTAYTCVIIYSGSSVPFYTIESGSMMHSDRSKIGVIDTGDMVIIKDPSKVCVVTYIEGHETGYEKFGDHGDVIIYHHPGGRTIIHRAILHLELNSDGSTWSIRGLDEYSGTKTYGGSDGAYTGTLTLSGFGYDESKSITVNLDSVAFKAAGSGYITMGDRNTMDDGVLVTDDMVIAVAMHEIPWLGCIKLFLTGTNTDSIPTNSTWSLIIAIALPIILLFTANFLYERRKQHKE